MLKHVAKRVLPPSVVSQLASTLTRLSRTTPSPPPLAASGPTRLNVGCGTDYREGFINIDGTPTLPRVDQVIDFTTEPLTDHFAAGSVDHILANDIIEHLFHWEAVNLLQQFHELLRPGGTVEIRVPDCEWVLRSRLSVEDKLWHFYGGQDIPQGRDEAMDKAREKYPQYFCHKYGWTMDRMQAELARIGFLDVQARRANTNFVTYAVRY